MSERVVYIERPRRNGCLWGCLGVLALVLAPLIFAWGYSAWFLYRGFRESPLTRTVIEMTQRDGLAQQVLGAPVTMLGVQGNAFSYMPGTGTHNRVILRVEGPKGAGTLDVTSAGDAVPKIETMILTGPDGRRYDLLKDKALDGPAPIPGNAI